MGTNHVAARRFASTTHDANFPRSAGDVFARGLDAKARTRTSEVRRANEFVVAAFLDACSFVAHEPHGAKITFVGGSIAIVIEPITSFGLRRYRAGAIDTHGRALRNALRANPRLHRIARFSSAGAREPFEEVHVIVVVAVVVERIGRRANVTVLEGQVKRIGRHLGDIGDRGNPRGHRGTSSTDWIPLLLGIMILKSRAQNDESDEPAFVGRIGLDVGAGNDGIHRRPRGHDDVDIASCGGCGRRWVDVVPTYAKVACRFMQQEGGLEIAKRRKDRRLGAGIGLKIDRFSAILKQRVELNFTVRRIDGHGHAVGLRDRRESRKCRKHDGKDWENESKVAHHASGPLYARGINIDFLCEA